MFPYESLVGTVLYGVTFGSKEELAVKLEMLKCTNRTTVAPPPPHYALQFTQTLIAAFPRRQLGQLVRVANGLGNNFPGRGCTIGVTQGKCAEFTMGKSSCC
ncbi:hypothetical protein Y032_0181g858 [Ancylostoma ceylanicum]|uniref:Uncharacterized protein n=1 Tax=Ancylostoma ceylanicum TaxID=53326 RepID=A0A016ST56_9BILA|nr:hypothetical protein Y032_0181g858 [Ancylostoma ceylanicum]